MSGMVASKIRTTAEGSFNFPGHFSNDLNVAFSEQKKYLIFANTQLRMTPGGIKDDFITEQPGQNS